MAGRAGEVRDRALTGLSVLLGIASVGFVVWVWARTDGLAGTLTSLSTPTANDANFLGLLSLDLMLLMVLLLARLPWLERVWGRQVLVRRHRRLGYWSFWLMVGHVALFALQRGTSGGFGGSGESGGRALWALFDTERHMLLATVGTVALVLVTATSTWRARRRLRYETWHWLHLWAYVGMGLVLPHVLIAADLAVGVVAAFFWTGYVAALAAVVWFRVVLPVWVSRRHALRVSSVSDAGSGAVSIEVGGRDLARLGARAGQFLTWRFAGAGRTRGHPYSLSAAPGETWRLTVRGQGDGARAVASVKVGAPVLVEGPYGVPGIAPRRHDRLLMVAAGVGVTPFLAVLQESSWRPGEVTLLLRVDHGDTVLGDDLAAVAALEGVTVVRLEGARRASYSWLPAGREGSDADVLADLVPDVADRDVWVCGPEEWSDAVVRAARAAGVRRRSLHVERFGW